VCVVIGQIMKTLSINIPDSLELNDLDVSMIVASKLYEEGKLSAGQAAEVAGLSKRAFIELIGKYNVSLFSNSISDLYSDIAKA
jgi:predicted HTH domain antitoxin